jgi:hypothetical protein
MMASSALDDLEEKRGELEFGTALAALTIVRYLADHCTSLPMGLLNRLTRTNDTIMALLPLLENPPWVRQNKGKVRGFGQLVATPCTGRPCRIPQVSASLWLQLERFSNSRWTTLSAADRLQLCQHDIQVRRAAAALHPQGAGCKTCSYARCRCGWQ